MTSYILDLEGRLFTLDETYCGLPFFRKMIKERYIVEILIARIIKKNPHPNIVKIYRIENNYIDIELVNNNYDFTKDILYKMYHVRDHLNKNNVAYIDWKLDNIGIGADGEPKLFDFDCSGIFKGTDWIVEPQEAYNYAQFKVLEPIEIDNCCLHTFLKKY